MTSVVQGSTVTLTSTWAQYAGGPATNLTGTTITITPVAGGAAIVGPTSTGVANPVTGTYTYSWSPSVSVAAGDYLASWSGTDGDGDTVTASETVTVIAAAAGQLYATLATVKDALGKLTTDDRDDLISAAITAASRMIDARTGRRFYLDDTATARTFPVRGRTFWDGRAYNLLVDDLGSTSGLIVETGSVFSSSWNATTTYATSPDNAIAQGRPITSLLSLGGWGYESVRVTARWGWPAVPAEVGQAAALLAARLYRRKDSPQGVIGTADWGAVRVSRVDPDVEALIAHLILPGFA